MTQKRGMPSSRRRRVQVAKRPEARCSRCRYERRCASLLCSRRLEGCIMTAAKTWAAPHVSALATAQAIHCPPSPTLPTALITSVGDYVGRCNGPWGIRGPLKPCRFSDARNESKPPPLPRTSCLRQCAALTVAWPGGLECRNFLSHAPCSVVYAEGGDLKVHVPQPVAPGSAGTEVRG